MNKRIVLGCLMALNAVCFSGCGDSTATSVPAVVKQRPVVASVPAQPKVVPQACQFGAKDKLLYNSVEQFKKKTLACLNPQSTDEEKNQYFKAFFDYLYKMTYGETGMPSSNSFDERKAKHYAFLYESSNGEGGSEFNIDYLKIDNALKQLPAWVVTDELNSYLPIALESIDYIPHDNEMGLPKGWRGLAEYVLRLESYRKRFPQQSFVQLNDDNSVLWLCYTTPYPAYLAEGEHAEIKEEALDAWQIYLSKSANLQSARYQFMKRAYPLLKAIQLNKDDKEAIETFREIEALVCKTN